MRNDSHKWDAPAESDEVLCTETLHITRIRPERQTIVSGVNALKQTTLPLVSWPGGAGERSFALVLRRDRILEINGPERPDGWDDASTIAVSDMTDGYAVLDVKGTGALELLKRGGFVDVEKESRSVARSLFGLPALLYRRRDKDHFTIHVSRTFEQTLRTALVSAEIAE